MEIEKYTPNSLSVSAILGLIASGDIAVPEIHMLEWKVKLHKIAPKQDI